MAFNRDFCRLLGVFTSSVADVAAGEDDAVVDGCEAWAGADTCADGAVFVGCASQVGNISLTPALVPILGSSSDPSALRHRACAPLLMPRRATITSAFMVLNLVWFAFMIFPFVVDLNFGFFLLPTKGTLEVGRRIDDPAKMAIGMKRVPRMRYAKKQGD